VGLNKEEEEGGHLRIRQQWAFLLKEPVIGSKSGFVKAVSLAYTTGIRFFAECHVVCRVFFFGHSAKKTLGKEAALPSAKKTLGKNILCRVPKKTLGKAVFQSIF
jgi:hypothetical protein